MKHPLTPTEILEVGVAFVNTTPYNDLAGYPRDRIAALKPMPVNHWLAAAEDILTREAMRLDDKLTEARARRLAAKVASHFVVPLRNWRSVA